MTRKLTVKKEIRTLGLDLCNPHQLVGAIVRGGTYLDGIVILPCKPIHSSKSVASAIVRTRFFPELRLIMTHDPDAWLDAKVIEGLTKLPVIQIKPAGRRSSDGFRLYTVGRKQLQVRSTLPTRILQEILSTTWTEGTLPEPLRIAQLVARSRLFHEKHGFPS